MKASVATDGGLSPLRSVIMSVAKNLFLSHMSLVKSLRGILPAVRMTTDADFAFVDNIDIITKKYGQLHRNCPYIIIGFDMVRYYCLTRRITLLENCPPKAISTPGFMRNLPVKVRPSQWSVRPLRQSSVSL